MPLARPRPGGTPGLPAAALLALLAACGGSGPAPAEPPSGVDAGRSTVEVSAPSAAADGQAAITVTVRARDAAGAPVGGIAVAFAASGAGNTLTPPGAESGADGAAATALRSTVAQAKAVSATAGGVLLTGPTVTFLAGPPSAATSGLAASRLEATADGADAVLLTATVLDALGNPIQGVPVTFSASGEGNVFDPAVATTSAAGVATTALRTTRAGARLVSAGAGALTLDAPAGVTFVAGPAAAAASALTASRATATADGVDGIVLTAALADAFGNPVAGAPVTFSASGGDNVLAPPAATTGPDGLATSVLRTTRAGARLLSAAAGGLTLDATAEVTFLAGPPAAATSALAASRTTATADGADAITLTATVADAFGNPVAGAAVAFSAGGTANTLTPAAGVTAADGTAAATLRSTRAEAKATSASVAGLTLAGPTVTFLAAPVSAATSSLVASTATATADGLDAVTLTATVKDAGGNPVPGVPVAFQAGGTGNALAPASAVTGAAGTATAVLTSTRAEAKALSATAGGVTLAGPVVTFVAGPPAVATSSLAASAAAATADGLEAVTLTATVRDAQGNPVPGAAVVFAASGAGQTLTPAGGVTSADGTAAAALRSTRAETKATSATVGGLTLAGPAVTFLPGAPAAATSSLVASKASATADGVDAVTLTATLQDAQGNPVPGVAVTFGASGAGNVLDPLVATTSAAGTAAATLRTTLAGARLVSASAGALTLDAAAPVTFVAGAPAAASSSLVASRASATADGIDAVTLTATLQDAQGNPVEGVTVTFAAGGTGTTVSPLSAVTGATGVATAALTSTVAGAKTLSATGGGLALTAPAVLFVAGAPDAATSSLVASKPTATADGVDGIVLTATLKDAQGNPVPGVAVTFAATGAGNVLDPSTATTGPDGVATTTLRSTVAGAKDLSASADPATLAGVQVSFVAPAAAAALALAATPEVALAGGQAVTVRATATDAEGRPLAGAAVAFSTGAAFATIAPSSAVTGADGVATASLSASTSGSVVVTAAAGAASARLPRPVEFVGTGAALQITEVGNAWFLDRPSWIEVFNNTTAPLDLSQYALRSSAVDLTVSTAPTFPTTTFTLPSLVVAPGSSAVIRGDVGGARAGPRVALVGSPTGRLPYWQGSGFVELQRLGQTVDFVRFGASAAAPATGPAWSGALPAFVTGPDQYRRALARAFDRRDTGSAADWAHVGFPTAGGPNDVAAGAVDLDADGIPDAAEAPGATYAGLDLWAMGARPGVRDAFVELDRMATTDEGAIPQQEALDRWLAMYPPHGLAVHVDAGSLLAGLPGRPYDLGQPDSLLAPVACVILDVPVAGCTTSLHDLKAQHMELARQNVFHYLLFALNDTASGPGGQLGRAEVGGNDVLVTMAGLGLASTPPVLRNVLVNRQRLVLAHEFGHNLGLQHGGHEEVADKPNYLSVMSYLYGDRGLPDPAWADAGQRWLQARGLLSPDPCQIRDGLCADPAVLRADYSDGRGAALDEAALVEALGLGRPGAAPVDWDRNGATGLASVDLNGDGQRTVLSDSDDWGRIVLPFAAGTWLTAPGAVPAGEPPAPAGLMPLAGDVQPSLE